MLRIILLATTLALTAASASAQITRIPDSGCPDAFYPNTSESAQIGQPFSLLCPYCVGNPPFIVLGSQRDAELIPPPIACVAEGCNLNVVVMSTRFTQGWSTDVPDDVGLVGACITAQCGCLLQGETCVELSGAVRICIEP